MGHNATVVVCLDQLDAIEKDSTFGLKLARAIRKCASRSVPIDIDHGAMVIETHHADYLVPVIIGGNCGISISASVYCSNESIDTLTVKMLREMARILGYNISKIPKKKSKAGHMAGDSDPGSKCREELV